MRLSTPELSPPGRWLGHRRARGRPVGSFLKPSAGTSWHPALGSPQERGDVRRHAPVCAFAAALLITVHTGTSPTVCPRAGGKQMSVPVQHGGAQLPGTGRGSPRRQRGAEWQPPACRGPADGECGHRGRHGGRPGVPVPAVRAPEGVGIPLTAVNWLCGYVGQSLSVYFFEARTRKSGK